MNQQIIIALMPYIVPSLIGLCVYIYHQVFQALPVKQQEALKQLELLAMPAVQSVEQLYANATPADKKAAAIHAIELGFQLVGLPVPDDAVINTFIEAAVFEMNRLKPASTNTQPLPTLQGGSIDPGMKRQSK